MKQSLEEILHTEVYLGLSIYVAKWNWKEPEVEITISGVNGYVYLHHEYTLDWWNSREDALSEVLSYWKYKIDTGEIYD